MVVNKRFNRILPLNVEVKACALAEITSFAHFICH
jgi:hypothetical protein